MRRSRSVQPTCNLTTDKSVQPKPLQRVQPSAIERTSSKLQAAGLQIQGNRIMGVSRLHNEPVQPKLPICTPANWRSFTPGERVLVRRGRRMVETVVPELDGDGNPME